MYKFFYILLFILSTNIKASDFGTTGIIDIPSARMDADGVLKITYSKQDIGNITNITYQATPWLQTTFRYTDNENYKDRSYSAKITLTKESALMPNIAIGIKDIIGTGTWNSEYIVATKKVHNFDISLGLGWGRLAEYNTIKNPLASINDSFEHRPRESIVGGRYGGKSRGNSFFRGSNVGVFGGIKYSIPNTNLKLLAEYNTDSYKDEVRLGVIPDSSPLSYGVEWNGWERFDFSLSHQQGNQLGLRFTTKLDTKSSSLVREIDPFYSSYDGYNLSAAPKTLNLDSWYDRLLHDFERSGLLLRSAKMSPEQHLVTIELSNFRYNSSADAIKRALTLSQIHVPKYIKKINILLNENGYKAVMVEYIKNNNMKKIEANNATNMISLSPPKVIINPTNITKFKVPSINFDANIAAKFQLFDPDLPVKHQVYLKIGSVVNLSQSWNLIGSYHIDLDNNFDMNRGPGSVLDHVRTDINRYLVEGETGIDSLYLERYSSIYNKIYYRLYLGILESMYSGLGIEVLYQPFMSRVAFGATINKVIKRGYERNFELLDYTTTTGFLSAYYASPFYNYDLALHVGRYLAGDKGATLEVRRTFDNGFAVGAFVTLTNVPAADFGEGSFDKGLFFKIPFDSFSMTNTKAGLSTVIRSLQRDGGQKLDDFSGRLWHDLRNVRYDNLIKNKQRMLPK
jgi:hypothetical protein